MQNILKNIVAFVALAAATAAGAQTVTGAFTPAAVAGGGSSTLGLNYSGFTSNSTGFNLRVYYDSAQVTPGAVSYSSPPGSSQPATAAASGTLASCSGANTFIILNWVDFNGTWPTPTSGSLASIPFTTAAGFSGSTNVCWAEDLTQGAPQRNVTGSAVLSQTITPTSAVFTISSPVNVTEAGATANAVVTCTGAFASNQVIPVAIAFTTTNAAGNFTTSASPVNFTACGGQTQNIVVTPRADDAVVQGAVSGSIALTAPAAAVGTLGTANTATVNVADNDGPPSVSVAVSGTPASEAGGVLTYTFTRTGNATQLAAALTGVAITPPPASSRYNTTCASPISFAANAATTSCTVTGVDNNLLDGNVNVPVSVAAGSGYTVGSPASATGVINDNEVGVGVTASTATITEGGLATFTLSCTGSGTFAVNYTVNTIATDGAVTPASPANLTCGTPLNVTVQTAQNTAPADSRPLALTITSVGAGAAIVPGQGSATVNVQDDDGPPPTIPTMGVFGLALLGLLMAGMGGLVQRRRK